jgi:hypothetical protein
LKKSRGGCSDYDIIDVEEQVGEVSPGVKYKERRVADRGDKTHFGDVCCKPLVPRTTCLFQTIEGLVQTTYMIRTSRVNKTWGLLTIYHFLEIAMKKSILDIKLLNWP